MKGHHDARIERLEIRLNPEASSDPMAEPIAPEHLAFLDEYERIIEHTTVAERQDPARGRELLRLAAENALKPLSFSEEHIAAYADELDTWLRWTRGEG
jgi:hypothetical protein